MTMHSTTFTHIHMEKSFPPPIKESKKQLHTHSNNTLTN